uniref:Uncharacterized protein n=1 Tax=Arundo donax TaxID=35708 RepID=A0A0A8ZYL9_ARUDO
MYNLTLQKIQSVILEITVIVTVN